MASRQANPADATNTEGPAERKRIPAGAPTLKLAVPEIPGYTLYWFTGKNVAKAIQGWYEHVKDDEIQLTQTGIGSGLDDAANSGLGTIVERAGGGFDDNGQAERLYLMKIKTEWFLEDQKAMTGPDSRLGQLQQNLKKGQIGMESRNAEDRQSTYVGKRSFVRNDPLANIFDNKE